MSVFLAAVADAQAVAGVARAYDEGSVPASPNTPYQTRSVSPDRAGGYTLDANHGYRMFRIVLRSFGKTLASALDMDTRAREELEDRRLEVDGWDCDPCRVELGSAVTRDPDAGGLLSVVTTYTFNATKEA